MKRIDFWEELKIKKRIPDFKIEQEKISIEVNEYSFELLAKEINEVAVFKNDHMTFDCLVLRISTNKEIYEIPYEIVYEEYKKVGDNFVIPKFKIKPLIREFRNIIDWLQTNLTTMNLNWLDELKIIDNTNLIINFKR